MSSSDRQATVEAFAAALSQGDMDAIDRYVDRDFYEYRPAAGEENAAEVTRQLVGDLQAALPDLQVSVGDFADEGDRLSLTLTVEGTSTNELWGAPPTGQEVVWTSRVTSRFNNGQMALCWPDLAVPDLLGVLRQVNLVPPPDEMDQPPRYPAVVPEVLLRLLFTGQMADKGCDHLNLIQVTETDVDVCQQCVAMGDVWPALRLCLICGHVGCCDTAKNKHARAHYEETGHPLARSIRLDESWVWCYEDNAFFSGRILEQYR